VLPTELFCAKVLFWEFPPAPANRFLVAGGKRSPFPGAAHSVESAGILPAAADPGEIADFRLPHPFA